MTKRKLTNEQRNLKQRLAKASRKFKREHDLNFSIKGRRIIQMGDLVISYGKILDSMYKTHKHYTANESRSVSNIIDRDLNLLFSIHHNLGEDYAKRHMYNRANFLDHVIEQVSQMVEPVTVVVDLNMETKGRNREFDYHVNQLIPCISKSNKLMAKFGINGTYTHELEEDRNGRYSLHMHAFMEKATYKRMLKATKDPKSPLFGCTVVMKNLFNRKKSNLRNFTNYITKSLVNSKMFGNEGGKRKIEARDSVKILTYLSPYLYKHVPYVGSKWGNLVLDTCNLDLCSAVFQDFDAFVKKEFRKAKKKGVSTLVDTADRLTKKALEAARIILSIGRRMIS